MPTGHFLYARSGSSPTGREACPDNLNEMKAYREAQVGQLKTISFYSQPLKIKDFRRFLFFQVLKMYARTPGKGHLFDTYD
jgi:hypothetical protein